MFYFSDDSDFMLFFVYLSCILIMVIVVQVKSLMNTWLLNLSLFGALVSLLKQYIS